LSERDIELKNACAARSPSLVLGMEDEKMRRFFWGLGLESEWRYALPLAEAILKIFGVEKTWNEWKEDAIRRNPPAIMRTTE
jgi:hypothetical protein